MATATGLFFLRTSAFSFTSKPHTVTLFHNKVESFRFRAANIEGSEIEGKEEVGISEKKKIFVAGATGNTGKRIVEQLLAKGFAVKAGVLDLGKAKSTLPGQNPDLQIVKADVTEGSARLADAIGNDSDAVICATGYRRSLDFLAPWKVDNFGTVNLVEACRTLGVKRFLLVSSILVNGAAMGQLFNPAYVFLNVLGLTLIAKLQAEQYIRRSGINYTIIRPGGLKNDPPQGNIVMEQEDTLYEGSISRDQVAEVAVEALLHPESHYKVVEIVARTDAPKRSFKMEGSEIKEEKEAGIAQKKKIFVAGATGSTGKRIVEQLLRKGFAVKAGVRNVDKAKSILPEGNPLLQIVKADVTEGSAKLADAIGDDSDVVICATGFQPSWNLLTPWKVDNFGTVNLVDACQKLGINRFILISSILVNGAAIGQLFNPVYILLNVMGLVLVAKLQAERYIRKSGINYTIIRPGGLKNDPPQGNIVMQPEDTLFRGSISRDQVAEVAVEALLHPESHYKVVEIVASTDAPKRSFEELFGSIKQQ